VSSLWCKGLTVRFGERVVLDSVSFDCHSGQALALTGPNGSGKTVLLDALCCFLKPESGRHGVADVELTGRSPSLAFSGPLARSFQHLRMLSNATVESNLRFAAGESQVEGVFGSIRNADKALNLTPSATARLDRLVSSLGLDRLSGKQARDLSFGERRLTAVACAFMRPARAILLDEPFSGLDGGAARAVGELFRQSIREGTSLLFVEHDRASVEQYADGVLSLRGGHVVRMGSAGGIL